MLDTTSLRKYVRPKYYDNGVFFQPTSDRPVDEYGNDLIQYASNPDRKLVLIFNYRFIESVTESYEDRGVKLVRYRRRKDAKTFSG